MKTKPFLSFWQIWNLTFGFLGIQFGFALQNANSSRILQTYGADVEQLSLFWLAAPLTGIALHQYGDTQHEPEREEGGTGRQCAERRDLHPDGQHWRAGEVQGSRNR